MAHGTAAIDSGVKSVSEQNSLELRIVVCILMDPRADGENRHARTAEHLFSDRTKQQFSRTGASVSTQHDEVDCVCL